MPYLGEGVKVPVSAGKPGAGDADVLLAFEVMLADHALVFHRPNMGHPMGVEKEA